MRRLFLALFIVATGAVSVAAADDFPYSNTHSFMVYRNGQPIGTHTLAFQTTPAGQRAVTTSIDFAVKAMGMTVYRYAHKANEIWNGSTLQSIDSKTDDNGKQYMMKARQNGGQLAIERKGAKDGGAQMNDQGLQRDETVSENLPASVMPSTHWNLNQVKQSVLLNTQYGTPSKVKITDLGKETIKTSSRTMEATHYRYVGDITMDQWFDDRGRWVKGSFKAFDGSEIEYILQE